MTKILLRSFSHPGVQYEVDKGKGSCSCPYYVAVGWCKHLEAVGSYKPRKITLSATPSYSQALSAVVKCIRVRNIEEGVYWLNYCWSFRERLTGSQFRTVRRLLIGSAEDGHSIMVMERVAENFGALLSKEVPFSDVIAELIRICKIPNWWHPSTGGHDYIYCGMLAARRTLYAQSPYSLERCLSGVAEAIEVRDKIGAIFWVSITDLSKGAGLALANRLHDIAISRNHAPAVRLMKNIYLRHAKVLSSDNNFLCQAAWLLAGGNSQVIDNIEPVSNGEVQDLLDRNLANTPHVIPGWCCDGVHCAGNDTRYMGMWDRMFAVCQQYNHYLRVSPDDSWLEDEFYSLDGLGV